MAWLPFFCCGVEFVSLIWLDFFETFFLILLGWNLPEKSGEGQCHYHINITKILSIINGMFFYETIHTRNRKISAFFLGRLFRRENFVCLFLSSNKFIIFLLLAISMVFDSYFVSSFRSYSLNSFLIHHNFHLLFQQIHLLQGCTQLSFQPVGSLGIIFLVIPCFNLFLENIILFDVTFCVSMTTGCTTSASPMFSSLPQPLDLTHKMYSVCIVLYYCLQTPRLQQLTLLIFSEL